MSRPYNQLTFKILQLLENGDELTFSELHKTASPATVYKEFYNNLFRLGQAGLIAKKQKAGRLFAQITKDGKLFLHRKNPQREETWKLVIFDIPEKHKKVRNILRAKLKQLFFKKWQNSIWASPYILDEEIEGELKELGKKYFVRLIKTTQINFTEELEKLFAE